MADRTLLPDETTTRRLLDVQTSLLAANEDCAAKNRARFQQHGLTVFNLVSSPGAGKTALLVATLERLAGRLHAGVIVGDLATENDAARLRTTGAPVVQITTGTLCHLDAQMIDRAADMLDLAALDLLFIENVGNLVCPAEFDLGETRRVVLLSTTEGEDKPLKYPPIFRFADAVVISKMDLAHAVEFDLASARTNIRRVNPQATLFELSARTGEGMEEWGRWVAGDR